MKTLLIDLLNEIIYLESKDCSSSYIEKEIYSDDSLDSLPPYNKESQLWKDLDAFILSAISLITQYED